MSLSFFKQKLNFSLEIISPLDIKMSSTSYGLLNCIDGKTNTFCETHGSETYPWVAVVIPRSIVRTVRITNRVDCCGDRMENVKVWVGKQFPSTSNAEYSGVSCL